MTWDRNTSLEKGKIFNVIKTAVCVFLKIGIIAYLMPLFNRFKIMAHGYCLNVSIYNYCKITSFAARGLGPHL